VSPHGQRWQRDPDCRPAAPLPQARESTQAVAQRACRNHTAFSTAKPLAEPFREEPNRRVAAHRGVATPALQKFAMNANTSASSAGHCHWIQLAAPHAHMRADHPAARTMNGRSNAPRWTDSEDGATRNPHEHPVFHWFAPSLPHLIANVRVCTTRWISAPSATPRPRSRTGSPPHRTSPPAPARPPRTSTDKPTPKRSSRHL
jgi:hypothetical protein